jgi:hypothetical protein
MDTLTFPFGTHGVDLDVLIGLERQAIYSHVLTRPVLTSLAAHRGRRKPWKRRD